MKTAHDLVLEAKQHITEINTDEAEVEIKNADIVIDIREPEEFHQGHIHGAVNIPRGILEFRLSSVPEFENREMGIVLYCKTNGRGALAAKSLKEMGYIQVKTIAGGMDAWTAADKPIAVPSKLDFD
ncbi:MAG: sulfurtransferase [Porticoccus sp.]|uniref:rhodanese-like domain-containing protein n=1 Tax=Porticoccus hydrocarbonoclasticus TaxID=1073414 RepID=UPI000C397541|nr:rhodanese-like domain-containing protein [Porticoccus hydrocarbonoclasticus]MBG56775.1 sulfurtransferase [Porticoccus sp.]|tara:strand:+ start:9928 stop:10308 length:381 start_codon:yes stop_codon:yes gene_type:complete